MDKKVTTVKGYLGIRATNDFMNWLDEREFYLCPASIKHHGNSLGGLYEHSLRVAKELALLTEKLGLVWEREESPYVVGLLHDVCKLDDYVYKLDGSTLTNFIESNKNRDYLGHGTKSVLMLAGRFELTKEEKMCIVYHMGAFTDKSEWEYYSRAVSSYPNVLYAHTADMIASQVYHI